MLETSKKTSVQSSSVLQPYEECMQVCQNENIASDQKQKVQQLKSVGDKTSVSLRNKRSINADALLAQISQCATELK